jgi:hypothetical protein
LPRCAQVRQAGLIHLIEGPPCLLESEVKRYKAENSRLESDFAAYTKELHNARGIIANQGDDLLVTELQIETLQVQLSFGSSAIQDGGLR